tara:strand:+ start:30540 stop:30872 length:333 start_codon:yes stop_codon:yes gene_type:complete
LDPEIAGRYYQQRAIRRVGEAFEKHVQHKALLVMATGSGKTRTVIALIDHFCRCEWANRTNNNSAEKGLCFTQSPFYWLFIPSQIFQELLYCDLQLQIASKSVLCRKNGL